MKELLLLRGLPGAGKTTLGYALGILPLSADDYFYEDGEYKFDASKLKHAHEWCKHRVEFAMENNLERIVVANTFTQEWEMETYYELAKKHGYRVHSLIVENRHKGVSVHNVPEETLEKMKNRFEICL